MLQRVAPARLDLGGGMQGVAVALGPQVNARQLEHVVVRDRRGRIDEPRNRAPGVLTRGDLGLHGSSLQERQERVLRALDRRWLVTGFTQEVRAEGLRPARGHRAEPYAPRALALSQRRRTTT